VTPLLEGVLLFAALAVIFGLPLALGRWRAR